MNINLEQLTYFYNKNINKKKIVLFGAGLVAKKIIENFDKSKISFILDNNKQLHGSTFENLKVFHPKKLNKIDEKKYSVVICTTSFIDIFNQIKILNKKLDINISHYLKDRIHIEYLQNLNKKILISSGLPALNKGGGGLFEINLKGDKFSIKKVYSGTVHGVIKYKGGYAISDSTNGVIIMDKNYNITKKGLYPPRTRAHGISCDENNNFYVACSMTDQIKIFNKDLRFKGSISISEKFKKTKLPQHHLNDILIKNGNLYVSMFSLSGNYKNNIYDGGVYEIDLQSKKIQSFIYSNLSMPHSIKYINDSFCILDSLNGDLIIGSDRVANFHGFSRGLSFDGELYFIGQSRNRNFSMINHIKQNISIDNSIIIFDRKNKIYRTIFLPYSISEIHEVLLIE
jgi:hypothetical protein